MSTLDPQLQQRARDPDSYANRPQDPGYGWVLFAAAMLGLLSVANFIDGIAAVSDSSFFVGDAKFVVSDLNTWGWVLIAIAAVQLVAAFAVAARMTGARWVGAGIAAVNAVTQLVIMPAYPFWALCLFALDILVIYGLIAYGAKPRTAA